MLTEGDWRRLEPLLQNIHPKRQRAAYNRLVLGWTLVSAGEPFGLSKQDVAMIVKAVLRWWGRLTRCRKGRKRRLDGWQCSSSCPGSGWTTSGAWSMRCAGNVPRTLTRSKNKTVDF